MFENSHFPWIWDVACHEACDRGHVVGRWKHALCYFLASLAVGVELERYRCFKFLAPAAVGRVRRGRQLGKLCCFEHPHPRGTLWGWALQGHSGIGHSRDRQRPGEEYWRSLNLATPHRGWRTTRTTIPVADPSKTIDALSLTWKTCIKALPQHDGNAATEATPTGPITMIVHITWAPKS